jgi:hypothetical protein
MLNLNNSLYYFRLRMRLPTSLGGETRSSGSGRRRGRGRGRGTETGTRIGAVATTSRGATPSSISSVPQPSGIGTRTGIGAVATTSRGATQPVPSADPTLDEFDPELEDNEIEVEPDDLWERGPTGLPDIPTREEDKILLTPEGDT